AWRAAVVVGIQTINLIIVGRACGQVLIEVVAALYIGVKLGDLAKWTIGVGAAMDLDLGVGWVDWVTHTVGTRSQLKIGHMVGFGRDHLHIFWSWQCIIAWVEWVGIAFQLRDITLATTVGIR